MDGDNWTAAFKAELASVGGGGGGGDSVGGGGGSSTNANAAIARLGEVVDQSTDLYEIITNRDKMLLRYVKSLCARVAVDEGLVENALWPTFASWLKENKAKASSYASVEIAEVVLTKQDALSLKKMVNDRLYVFKRWGIAIAPALESKIAAMKVKWNANEQAQQVANLEAKNEQTHVLLAHWGALLGNLALTPPEFKAKTTALVPPIDTIHYCQMKKKTDAVFQGNLLRTRAQLSFGRVTGCRSKHVLSADVTSALRVLDDNRLLYRYQTGKNGKKKATSKTNHVALQLNSEPSLCATLHLAEFVVYVAFVLNRCWQTPFLFDSDPAMDPINRHAKAYTESTSIYVTAAAISSIDVGKVKLHILRSACNDILIRGKVPKAERQDHLGWSGDIDDKHYSNSEHCAIASDSPRVLAGGAAHAIWQHLGSVPTDVLALLLPECSECIMVHFRKVVLVALAAGLSPPSFAAHFNDISRSSAFNAFKVSVVATMRKAATVVTNDPINLKRQVFELRGQLARSEAEVKRLRRMYEPDQTTTASIPAREATETVISLVDEVTKGSALSKKSIAWLTMCHDRVTTDIVPLIKQCGDNDGFLIGLSGADGKRLQGVLMLAAAFHNHRGVDKVELTNRQTWMGHFASHKKTSTLFEGFRSDCWSGFLATTNLDKPMAAPEFIAL
jgi:hypothetical protein